MPRKAGRSPRPRMVRRQPSVTPTGRPARFGGKRPDLLPAEEKAPDVGVARQLGSGPRHRDPACAEHVADIGKLQPFPGVLFDQDDGPALALLKLLQYFKHHVDHARLKPDRWLVNQQAT